MLSYENSSDFDKILHTEVEWEYQDNCVTETNFLTPFILDGEWNALIEPMASLQLPVVLAEFVTTRLNSLMCKILSFVGLLP